MSALLRLRHPFFRSMSYHRPSPPPLPLKEQIVFDELVRAAAAPAAPSSAADIIQPRIQSGSELHPDARRLLAPEFEGDVNPLTGEQGGPKREPLRHGDWSYGGRTTDF